MSDIRDWTDGLKYKPGWKFTLDRDLTEGYPVLTITAAVLHSDTLEPVTFAIKRLVPEFAQADDGLFLQWVKTLLAEAEIHEMREFLRFYGSLVDDPHTATPANPARDKTGRNPSAPIGADRAGRFYRASNGKMKPWEELSRMEQKFAFTDNPDHP